jgi:hypothetical protein
MHRFAAIYHWDLMQGLRNRFLQVFALVCAMGGTALLAAAPGPETLPLILIQTILFFGSLLAFLVGWSSGQQARMQGAFLFAQPLGAFEMVGGKLLGTGTWCAALLLLFLAPSLVRAQMPDTLLVLGILSMGYLLVCLLGGLLIGLTVSPISGLLLVLLIWVEVVAGWELGLLMLTQLTEIDRCPGAFIALLLSNPAGTFRVGSMIGLKTVPFDASELETGRFVFQHMKAVSIGIFALWSFLFFILAGWRTSRQEF